MLDDLVAVIEIVKARIVQHKADLQANETRTRTALIDPLLRALGWDVSDPSLVTPEYALQGKWVDYALIGDNGGPAVLVEAKKLGESLAAHQTQMVNYAVTSGVPYAGLSDGNHWELYKVFDPKPLEEKRVLDVFLVDMPAHQCALQLLLLWRPNTATGQPMQANGPIAQGTWDPPLPPPPSSLPPTPGWTQLADFQAKLGDKPPLMIRFHNGEERPVTTWKSILVETAEWLTKGGHLTASKCPIKMGPKRHQVHTEPIHSEGTPFVASASLSNGLFLETNLSAPAIVSRSCSLVKQLGQDPSHVYLRTT